MQRRAAQPKVELRAEEKESVDLQATKKAGHLLRCDELLSQDNNCF